MKTTTIILLGLVTAISGCATDYSMKTSAPTARLNLSTTQFKTVCADGKLFNLRTDANNIALVEAGKRITVRGGFYNYVYGGVSTSCTASSSFVPQENREYFLDFQVESEHCSSIIYQVTNKGPTGLAWEPSLQPSRECRAK